MKQYPKKLKFKKYHRLAKSILFLNEQKIFYPLFGSFALRSLECGSLTYKQIEACRKSLKRNVDKKENIYLRAFTNFPVTKKSLGARMGKGKGNFSYWKCPIKAGQIICEVGCFSEMNAIKALKSASWRLPFKTKIVKACY